MKLIALTLLSILVSGPALGQGICSDLQSVVAEHDRGFKSKRDGKLKSSFGSEFYDTKGKLPEAITCRITKYDRKDFGYSCVWKGIDSDLAVNVAEQIRGCLGFKYPGWNRESSSSGPVWKGELHSNGSTPGPEIELFFRGGDGTLSLQVR